MCMWCSLCERSKTIRPSADIVKDPLYSRPALLRHFMGLNGFKTRNQNCKGKRGVEINAAAMFCYLRMLAATVLRLVNVPEYSHQSKRKWSKIKVLLTLFSKRELAQSHEQNMSIFRSRSWSRSDLRESSENVPRSEGGGEGAKGGRGKRNRVLRHFRIFKAGQGQISLSHLGDPGGRYFQLNWVYQTRNHVQV